MAVRLFQVPLCLMGMAAVCSPICFSNGRNGYKARLERKKWGGLDGIKPAFPFGNDISECARPSVA